MQKQSWPKIIVGLTMFFVIGVAIFYLPCPSDSQYIYFRISLGLSVAILAVLFIGKLEIKGKIYGYQVTAVGSFAIFLIVLKFTPNIIDTSGKCMSLNSWTVFLKDSANHSIEHISGSVKIQMKDYTQKKSIDADGRVLFEFIPAKYINEPVHIESDISGFFFALNGGTQAFDTIYNNTPLSLKLGRDQSLCCFSVSIWDEDGNPISNSTVVIDYLTLKMDSSYLKISLPKDLQSEQVTMVIIANGYKKKTVTINPLFKETNQIHLNKVL